MPYTPSSDSQNIIAQLRQLLGGGSGGGLPVSNATPPSKESLLGLLAASNKPQTKQFFTPILPGAPGGIIDPSGTMDTTPQAAPVDPVEQFLMQMAGSIGQGGAGGLNGADYEQALKDSAAQIKGAFGAEIGAVKASSANARHQTKRSKKQVKAMYNALSKQYDKSATGEIAQGQQVANALTNVANQASGQVKGTSDQLLNEQAALAQGLGVQSALPDVAAAQQANVANQVGNIQTTGARNASTALASSGNQQRFLNRGGRNALLEGTNRRADLVQQLQAFLQQNMGKIADIQGQRGQALAANETSLAKSFGDKATSAANAQWGQEKDMASLLLALRGQNNAADKQNSYEQQQGTSNLIDLMKLLSSSAANTQDPKKMAEVMQYIQDALKAQAGG